MGFLQLLENVVTRIRGMQQKHEKMGQTIRSHAQRPLSTNGKKEMPENQLTYKLQKQPLSGKMGGVDSGFAGQSFYALDLMMLRTVGVCFTYENGKLSQTNYHPETFSLPDPIINTEGYEREEFHKFVSLTRLQAEVQNAIELIQQTKPLVCFLDGSLIPHPLDKPGSDSPLKIEYEKTIRAFVTLYETAEKNECTLIGAIEDSRSTRLSEWIHENMVLSPDLRDSKLHDAPLLERVLQAGERSMAFPYAESPEKHIILTDVPEKWRKRLFACYLKPSQWDYPLRVEFLSDVENASVNAQRVGEIAYAQSCLHKEYAFPSVLIEADLRAGLKQEEVELVGDKILSKLGRHTLRLKRRDRRPF